LRMIKYKIVFQSLAVSPRKSVFESAFSKVSTRKSVFESESSVCLIIHAPSLIDVPSHSHSLVVFVRGYPVVLPLFDCHIDETGLKFNFLWQTSLKVAVPLSFLKFLHYPHAGQVSCIKWRPLVAAHTGLKLILLLIRRKLYLRTCSPLLVMLFGRGTTCLRTLKRGDAQSVPSLK